MPIESGLRGRSRGCISGSDIVSVMPQICRSGAPKRVCQSSSCCTVTFCAVSYAQNVTVQQLEDWHTRFGAPLLQIWGMTETMSLPLMQPLDLPRKPLSMGMPVLGYTCKIVDDAGG